MILLLLVLGLPLVALLGFLGCDHMVRQGSQGPAHGDAELTAITLELKFDPNMSIGTNKVAIDGVEFVIHREGGGKTLDNTERANSNSHTFDFNGWGTSSDTGVVGLVGVAQPQWGHYLMGFSIATFALVPTRWQVQCNAFKHADDKDPTYSAADPAAGGTIERHVEDVGRTYSFAFNLRSDGKISERSTEVVFSFAYNVSSPVDLARVVFTVTVDSGNPISFTITPPSTAMPAAPFPGTMLTDVVGLSQGRTGTWHATLTNAPLGHYFVSCMGYTAKDAADQPHFGSGGVNDDVVDGNKASYLFDFEVKNGKTVPKKP